jgi:hypothetical protein
MCLLVLSGPNLYPTLILTCTRNPAFKSFLNIPFDGSNVSFVLFCFAAPPDQEQKGLKPHVHQQISADGFAEQRNDKPVGRNVEKRHESSTDQSADSNQNTSTSYNSEPAQRPGKTFVESPMHIPLNSTHNDLDAPAKRVVLQNASNNDKQRVRNSVAAPEQAFSQMQASMSTDELSGPEPLTDAVKAESAPLQNLIDLHYVQCLYSKQWQLRDKACQYITKLLETNGLGGDSSSYR